MPNNDNKDIKFTGDPVAFDGVEGKRDPKTGKGRFDLIPTEVYYPLFSKADHDWLLDCHPASILMSIADEKFIEAIIKMTIYAYVRPRHNEDYAASSSEFWHGVWPMLQDLAIHFQKGAEHYGERNCQKGIPLWSFKDSAMRHATQVFEGKTDEPHSISVIWNCWLAAWTVITSDKKDDTNEFNSFEMTLKILRDRRKNAKTELFNTPSDSPEFKEKKNDINEMKKFINALSQLSDELNIPVVTAQQTSYTREEVEAIKKEAAEKAIEDFLNDRSPENVDRIIKEIGVQRIIESIKKFPLGERQLFTTQFADLMSTPEGKKRARWFYSPEDLLNDLIERIEKKAGFGEDYRKYLRLLIKLNTVYGDYLQEETDGK